MSNKRKYVCIDCGKIWDWYQTFWNTLENEHLCPECDSYCDALEKDGKKYYRIVDGKRKAVKV